jgi:hypothetical protein
MKMHKATIWFGFTFALVLCLGLVACELDEVEFTERTDDTNPNSFRVGSIGNSLTAGFQNGGIREDGQQASFANLLARAMTGREMQMPLVAEPGIGSASGLSSLFVEITPSGGVNITRKPLTQAPQAMALNLTYPVPYDNLGVPGATTAQMLHTIWGDPGGDADWTEGRDANNALFNLILRNAALPSGSSMVGELEFIHPEVVTIWTGNNEILGGSLSGEPVLGVNIVPASVFEADLIEMLDRVAAFDPQIVAVGNVPPIGAIPYVRLWSVRPPSAVLPTDRWNMEEDHDDNGDPDVIDADPVALVLQTAPVTSCIECYDPRTCGEPGQRCLDIPANQTLSVSELALINDTITAYNAIIAREVAARGWAAVDVNTAFLAIPTSAVVGPLNTAFPIGVSSGALNINSAFTLDGVHPSERGHARVANLFLEAINDNYGMSYPMYDLTDFENYAGLELVRGAAKAAPGPLRFTAEGLAGLEDMVEMMQGRF